MPPGCKIAVYSRSYERTIDTMRRYTEYTLAYRFSAWICKSWLRSAERWLIRISIVDRAAARGAADDRRSWPRRVRNSFPAERFREMIYYAAERGGRGTEPSVTQDYESLAWIDSYRRRTRYRTWFTRGERPRDRYVHTHVSPRTNRYTCLYVGHETRSVK